MITFQLRFAPVHVKVESLQAYNRATASSSVKEYLRSTPERFFDAYAIILLSILHPEVGSAQHPRHVVLYQL